MKRKPLIGLSVSSILLLGIAGTALGFSNSDMVEVGDVNNEVTERSGDVPEDIPADDPNEDAGHLFGEESDLQGDHTFED
ncbi:hypothetical protein ACE1TF_05740 [Geomicrobium sp. JSM 1781026]|uniref:hypothetical protein n=1 Tax=Geomicrobium sp. JSM 1781026 TaxID=3344580 RepID=UPI0035C1ACB5